MALQSVHVTTALMIRYKDGIDSTAKAKPGSVFSEKDEREMIKLIEKYKIRDPFDI